MSTRGRLWVELAVMMLGACGGPAREARTARPVVSAPVVRVAQHDDVASAKVGEPVIVRAAEEEEAVAIAPEIAAPAEDAFFGRPDAPVREALAHGDIAEVERGRGGRSIAFVVTLEDGTRGYFKPDQSFDGTSWYAEIAAYHLDRELGLGRVAPVVGRRIRWSELSAAAGHDARVSEVALADDGTVVGAFVAWVPARPTPLPLAEGWESWLRVDGTAPAVTPFQRPPQYQRALARAREHEVPALEPMPEPDREERPAELSDMLVFDYLTQNLDRWGGHNTNVRTVGSEGPLMYLDNAAAFTLRGPHVPMGDRRLEQVQRFRRSTIDAVRALDVDHFAARLQADPLAPSLDARQLRNLETRRQRLLAYVDQLVEEHGEDAVYAF